MAGTTTPAPRPRALAHTIRHWQGRALLWTAKTLQNTIVGRHRRKALTAQRNRAIRAAHAHGVPAAAIAKAVDLKPKTVTGICGKSTAGRDESATEG